MRAAAREIVLPPREREGPTLVTVLTCCFNDGRHLPSALATIREQTWPEVEVVVIDDASTDPLTIEVLDRLEGEPGVRVLRLPENRGAAGARNAGVAEARGRYVIPLDADNEFVPETIELMVTQLREAPGDVGFIYPQMRFFGNRHDRFRPPSYNLFTLLQANYCDTGSLIDRSVFDAGLSYPTGLYREDWQFALTLAKHGIRGEPSDEITLRTRKRGFNRSEMVGHKKGAVELDERTRSNHPEFYSSYEAYAGIKAEWLPSLSIIATRPLGPDDAAHEALRERLGRQRCIDAEVLLFGDVPHGVGPAPYVRSLGESRLAPAEAIAEALRHARGTLVFVTEDPTLPLLEKPGFIDQLYTVFQNRPRLGALALADGGEGVHSWRPLEAEPSARPLAVGWGFKRIPGPIEEIRVTNDDPLGSLARGLAHQADVEWRHFILRSNEAERPAPVGGNVQLLPVPGSFPEPKDRVAALQATRPLRARPLRWERDERQLYRPWRPPLTVLVHRHVHRVSGGRVVNLSREPPSSSYNLERTLGAARRHGLPGTVRLEARGPAGSRDVTFSIAPEADEPEEDVRTLGFIEEAALPMLVALKVGTLRQSGQETVFCGPNDPLNGQVDDVRHLGFIEPTPLAPPRAAHVDPPVGVVGLTRGVATDGWRHEYAAGEPIGDRHLCELGGLAREPGPESIPIWLSRDGRVVVGSAAREVQRSRPPITAALRWSVSPLRWRRFRTLRYRIALATRRSARAAVLLLRGFQEPPDPIGEPAGYLYTNEKPKRAPLFLAVHPVTGDQFLSVSHREIKDLGYPPAERIGYLLRYAPVTGRQWDPFAPDEELPWAWKSGCARSDRARRVG